MSRNSKILISIIFLTLLIGCIFYKIHQPTISIVAPSYNRAHFLPRFLDNILSQEYQDFEVIVINDGSTDNTDEILASYQKKDNRIRVIKNEKNLGLIGSGNRGLDAARGKYIARIDDDDLTYPTWLLDTIEFFKKHPEVDVVFPFRDNQINEHRKEKTPQARPPLTEILRGNIIGNSGSVFKRSFLEKHHIRYNPDRKSAEDYDLWSQFLRNGAIIRRLPKTLISMHTDSKHSAEYYNDMVRSSHLISTELINFFKASADNKPSLCSIYKEIASNPQKSHLFQKDEIETAIIKECPFNKNDTPHVQWIFKHRHWQDKIIFEKETNKIRRLQGDKATIISIKDNQISVKWDNWGIETFECNTENVCTFVK